MTGVADLDSSSLGPVPIAPSLETWRRMSGAARQLFLEETNAYLSDPRLTMNEGRPHKLAKSRFVDALGLHFRSVGTPIYLADDLAVHYPGETVFSPDVIAVLGVEQPDDDPRLAWVVADEARGPDLVLEVLHHGDRKKDPELNVTRYANLGIAEYFVFDRAKRRVIGYRLPRPGPGEYEPLIPQHGRIRSHVLGLDLALVGGDLRVFAGVTELIGTQELLTRVQGLLDGVSAQAAQAEAEAARAQAEAARAQAEALREAVTTVLAARGLEVDEAQAATIAACSDPGTLRKWLTRAATVADLASVLG